MSDAELPLGADSGCWSAAERAENDLPLLLVVAAGLVDIDGRVLIARRPEGKPMAGLWEFPGGKVKAGESPEAALIRELDEELGIDTRESCLSTLLVPPGVLSDRTCGHVQPHLIP